MNIPRLAKLKLVLGEISEYTDIQKDLLVLFYNCISDINLLHPDINIHFNFYININTKTLFYNETTVYDYVSSKYLLKRSDFESQISTLLRLLDLNKYMLMPIKLN